MFQFDGGYAAFDVTALPNTFIREYLPGASGDYVKVYLYALMLACHTPKEMDLSAMAKELGMEESDVLRAFSYWERRRLVVRVKDKPPVFSFVHPQQVLLSPAKEDKQYEQFSEALYAMFGDERKLHGGECSMAFEWVEDMGLPKEIVLMLVQHCISNRGMQFNFKEAQKMAAYMAQNQITTIDAAEHYFAQSEAARKGTQRILNRLGKYRLPSEDEVNLYTKWTEQWGYKPAAIEGACRQTTKGEPTMAYLDGILKGMMERNGGKPTENVEAQINREDAERESVKRFLATLGSKSRMTAMTMNGYRHLCTLAQEELVMLAAEYASRKDRHRMDDVEELLLFWQKKGFTTREQVLASLEKQNEGKPLLREIYAANGANGNSMESDLTLLNRWQTEMAFPPEVILLCAGLAAGKEKPMGYMNTVLSAWNEKGIHTVEQAVSESAARRAVTVPAVREPKRVTEQMYTQREREKEDVAANMRRVLEESDSQ